MEYRKIKDQDKDGEAVEDDIESSNGKPHSGPVNSVTTLNNLSKWKLKSTVTIALTVLTSSQGILIAWSKRAGKYEYSVTTKKSTF
ncbi:hypothetical protein NE237_025318 [Protea cynaroides]|uniref:Uncharacterized protein n=1 Tax=Protea cynaroides TaxID=273540 RepID=A0A9Q0H1P3_9MAGN|nr:hypothetical protein NE237_025318 [Protea cynaroides]